MRPAAKRLLLVLVSTVLLALAGAALFLMTFDADRYRPLLTGELTRAIGKPVKLERLTLGWDHGLAVRLHGVAIMEGPESQREPLIQAESVSAVVQLAPLLRGSVRVTGVLFYRPRIHVARSADGAINLLGLAVAASPAAASRSAAPPAAKPPALSIASLRIVDGSLHWTDATHAPVAELTVKALDAAVTEIAPGRPMKVEAKGAVGGGTPNLRFAGRLTAPVPGQPGSLEDIELSLERVPLALLMSSPAPDEPRLTGQLTVRLQGRAPTLDPDRWRSTISLQGEIQVADPVLKNLNVLREVFAKLSVLPGLMERLESRLPPAYRSRLAEQDTALRPLAVSAGVEEGIMRFSGLRLGTEAFEVVGSGGLGLDGTLAVQSTLRIEPVFSDALIKSVSELRYLANARGEIELPFSIQRRGTQLSVLPDLSYVASRVIVSKVGDLLDRVLEPSTERSEGEADGDTLTRFLHRALRSDEPSASPEPSLP